MKTKYYKENPTLLIFNEKNKLITKNYVENLMKRYGVDYKVKDIQLFIIAMTHESYTKREREYYESNKVSKYIYDKDLENVKVHDPKKCIPLNDISYQRLEFKGDAVIHNILGDYLYERYEEENEGFMTKLRTKIESSETLAKFSKLIGLNEYILISRHMENDDSRNKNTSLLEDVFEAFIGALSCNTTYENCYKFFISLIEEEIDFTELLYKEDNYKDILLRYFHKMNWEDPEYKSLGSSGHERLFTSAVKKCINPSDKGEILGSGIGKSKKKSEQNAAQNVLITLGVIEPDDDILSCSDYSSSYESVSEFSDSCEIKEVIDNNNRSKNYSLNVNEYKIDHDNYEDSLIRYIKLNKYISPRIETKLDKELLSYETTITFYASQLDCGTIIGKCASLDKKESLEEASKESLKFFDLL